MTKLEPNSFNRDTVGFIQSILWPAQLMADGQSHLDVCRQIGDPAVYGLCRLHLDPQITLTALLPLDAAHPLPPVYILHVQGPFRLTSASSVEPPEMLRLQPGSYSRDWAGFLQNIQSCVDGGESRGFYFSGGFQDVHSHGVLEAQGYILQSYDDPKLSLKAYCGVRRKSLSYMSTTFKKYSQIKFNEFLHEVRMSHALNHLYQGRLSLKEIAARVGYKDQRYFSTSFRQTFEKSPRHFRKTLRIEALYCPELWSRIASHRSNVQHEVMDHVPILRTRMLSSAQKEPETILGK